MVLNFTGDTHTVLQLLFFIMLLFFSVYALLLGYHWFTFGHEKRTAMIALAVYLSGGAVLLMILAGSIQLI
jgi:hypothetical protein